MKRYILLIASCIFSLNAVHAEITWTLSDDGTLTISGTDMPNYDWHASPWFSQGDKIKKIIIEDGVTRIGDYAFSGCSGLTSITIPNSVTSIGSSAFYNCSGLTSITIPNSVTSIGSSAFSGCSGLTSIAIGKAITNSRRLFSDCSNITSVTILDGVTSIGYEAFYGCKGLTSVTIPESVTSIGERAFHNCSNLTSITIPKSVNKIGHMKVKTLKFRPYALSMWEEVLVQVPSIGEYAFAGCSGLTSIICEASIPPTCAENSFDYVNKSIPVYVPANNAYKNADGWKEFTNIQTVYNLLDDEPFTNDSQKSKCIISYIRTFNNTQWQALYIPFSLDYDDWKDDFEVAYIYGVRQFDKNNDGTIDKAIIDVAKIKSGSIKPNPPYLIRAKTIGKKVLSTNNRILYEAEENSECYNTATTKYIFTGTYKTISASVLIDNKCYAMGGGAIIMTDGLNGLKPYRWYMRVETKGSVYNVNNIARAVTINVISEENGVTGSID